MRPFFRLPLCLTLFTLLACCPAALAAGTFEFPAEITGKLEALKQEPKDVALRAEVVMDLYTATFEADSFDQTLNMLQRLSALTVEQLEMDAGKTPPPETSQMLSIMMGRFGDLLFFKNDQAVRALGQRALAALKTYPAGGKAEFYFFRGLLAAQLAHHEQNSVKRAALFADARTGYDLAAKTLAQRETEAGDPMADILASVRINLLVEEARQSKDPLFKRNRYAEAETIAAQLPAQPDSDSIEARARVIPRAFALIQLNMAQAADADTPQKRDTFLARAEQREEEMSEVHLGGIRNYFLLAEMAAIRGDAKACLDYLREAPPSRAALPEITRYARLSPYISLVADDPGIKAFLAKDPVQ